MFISTAKLAKSAKLAESAKSQSFSGTTYIFDIVFKLCLTQKLLNVKQHTEQMPCISEQRMMYLLYAAVSGGTSVTSQTFFSTIIQYKAPYCKLCSQTRTSDCSLLCSIFSLLCAIVQHLSDMIFVKSFTPVDFPTFRNLPGKVRNLRHLRSKILIFQHFYTQN